MVIISQNYGDFNILSFRKDDFAEQNFINPVLSGKIHFKNKSITILNDLNSELYDGVDYIVSDKLLNDFNSINVLNCDKQEIERIML